MMVKQKDWVFIINLRINSQWLPCSTFEPHNELKIYARPLSETCYWLFQKINSTNIKSKYGKYSMMTYLVWRDETVQT